MKLHGFINIQVLYGYIYDGRMKEHKLELLILQKNTFDISNVVLSFECKSY